MKFQTIVVLIALFFLQAPLLASDSIPLATSPSGTKRFTFKSENVQGKKVYKMVKIPYASQPVYVNFINKDMNSKNRILETNLFDDQNLTKLLGTVIIKYDGHSLSSAFKSVDGKEMPFVPDFYMGKCTKRDPFTAYHSVHEVKDKLARLGEGPWGKQAWVKASLSEFDRLRLRYEYNGERFSSLYVGWDNDVEFGPYNHEFNNYYSFSMPVASLLAGSPNHIEFKLACDTNFSSRYEVDPMVVDLAPTNFAPYNESAYVDPNSEKKEAFACKFIYEKRKYSEGKIELSLDKPVDVLFLTYADSDHMNYPRKNSDSEYYFSNVRSKSSPIFFTVTEDQNIKVSVFQIPVLNEKSDVKSIQLKSPEKYIRHKFLPSAIPADAIVKLYVSNFELGRLSTSNPLEIDFSPGDYLLKLRSIRLKGESTEEYFNLNVTADQIEQKKTIDLAKVHLKKHFYLNYDDNSGKIGSVTKAFVKTIDKFSFVSDRVIDLTAFLVPNKLEPKRPEELKQFLDPIEAGSIIAEGICEISNSKTSFHSISIHSSPSDTSITLGALKLKHYKNAPNIDVSFIRPDGFVSEFRPNLFGEVCVMRGSVLLLHQVNNVKGNWTDLGQGPWGSSGWIKVAAKPLFDNDLAFEVDGVGYGKLKKKSNDNWIFTPEKNYYGADQNAKDKDVPRSKLINENGIAIPKIICELGC